VREWVGRHQGSVWRYLRFLGADPDVASDLTQDAFLAALRAGAIERADPSAAALLRLSARHRYLSLLRQRHRRPSHQDLDEGEAAWQWFAGQRGDGIDGALDRLRSCVATLDPRQQHALHRIYREGATHRELGTDLQLQPEGVKALLRRIRARLRACMERRNPTDHDTASTSS